MGKVVCFVFFLSPALKKLWAWPFFYSPQQRAPKPGVAFLAKFRWNWREIALRLLAHSSYTSSVGTGV